MKQFYTKKKDGTTKQYASNYKSINDVDYLCTVYNEMNNLKARQVGSLEQQTDMCGSRIVKIGNEFGGHFVLKDGTKKELIDYIRTLIQSKERNLRR